MPERESFVPPGATEESPLGFNSEKGYIQNPEVAEIMAHIEDPYREKGLEGEGMNEAAEAFRVLQAMEKFKYPRAEYEADKTGNLEETVVEMQGEIGGHEVEVNLIGNKRAVSIDGKLLRKEDGDAIIQKYNELAAKAWRYKNMPENNTKRKMAKSEVADVLNGLQ